MCWVLAARLRLRPKGFDCWTETASGTADAGGGKGPGAAVGTATFIATPNPAGLIVSSGMKVHGEASGKSKIAGRADVTVQEIAAKLKTRFQEAGWIQ